MPFALTRLAPAAAVAAILTAGLAAQVAPAQAMTLGVKEFTCPIDGKKFKATVARSGTSFGMRLDLKRIGPIAQPWPMPACPGNGFTLYKRKFTKAEIAKLRKIVATPAFKAVRAANTNYYVAAWLQEKMGARPHRVALYYLRATWEAERGDKARHRRYLEMTLRYFKAHLKGGDLNDRRNHAAALLAANLERRLGRFDAAQKRLKALTPHLKRPVLKRVAAQIDDWAAKKNDQPQKFVNTPRKKPKQSRK